MTGLTDMIPELYQTAYARYQDEGNNLMQQYSMLKGQDDAAYNRYRDAMSDARYQQQLDYQQERDAITDERYQKETAYSRQQDAYKNLYSMILSYGYQPTAQELAAAGMTDAVAKTLLSDYARRNPAPVAAPAESGRNPKKNTLASDVSALKEAGLSSAEINKFIALSTAKGGEYEGTSAAEKAKIRIQNRTLSR